MFKNCCNILELHCKVLHMSSKPNSYQISISCCSLVNSANPKFFVQESDTKKLQTQFIATLENFAKFSS